MSACNSTVSIASPAVLVSDDKQSRDILRSAILDSVGGMRVANIEGDPLVTSTFIASPYEPTQYEMNYIHRPVWFELVIRDGICYLVNKNDNFEVELPDLKCKIASS